MKEKFTKGDWVITEGDAFLDGSQVTSRVRDGMIPIVEVKYAYLDNEDKSEIEIEQIANAHLIAAAPEMYKKIKQLVKVLDDLYPSDVTDVDNDHIGEFIAVSAIKTEANNLLDKARGEAS